MPHQRLKTVITLCGDLENEPGNQVKYSHLINSLRQHLEVVEVYNASLQGFDKWFNAFQVFHPKRSIWRQRFYKNVAAFQKMSQKTVAHLSKHKNQAHAVIQIGTLLDSCYRPGSLPGIIYTDYTARLSAQKPDAGRSPFSHDQRQHWLEMEGMAFHNAAHIFARSDLVKNSITCDYDIPPEKVSVIGAGVNFDPLPSPSKKAEGTPPVILFIGKAFYRKGGDLLLQAFSKVRQKYPLARLSLVTGGPIPSELPLSGVDVIPPTWDRDIIQSLYQNADIFVLPSRLETWGDVLLEAMAYQLPCIGVAGDAMDEIILHENTGLIVPPEDVAGLAQALDRLLSKPELRIEYGSAGRKRVEENFTWDLVAERLTQTLYKVLGINPPEN